MPRNYQEEQLKAIRERIESGGPIPPVELPAGFGKSPDPEFVQMIGRGQRPDADGSDAAK